MPQEPRFPDPGQAVSVLEVAIGPGQGPRRFRVEVVSSPAGEASAVTRLDARALLGRREELQQAVLTPTGRARQVPSDAERLVREIGQELFSALLGVGEVAGLHRASAALAAERGQNLRLVLRIEDPVLAGLPWEAMYDETMGSYVCRREQLVRHIPVPSRVAPLTVRPPLRILGIVSAPRGLPSLRTDLEQEVLETGLARVGPGAAEVVWASSAAWADLQETLQEGQWHVIHFIGHGLFDGGGVLALTGPDGRADLIEASRLVDLLRQASPMPRLAVLNSCSGATTAATDLFSGTAAALVLGGVSAVVAMQYAISDRAARAFAHGFYGALARGRGVDEAVSSGRTAIVGLNGRTLEWITPVLYLRGHDSRLFRVTGARSHADAAPENSRRPRSHGPSHLLRVLTGHTGGIRCVTFSPDGSGLASAGSDKTVRLWKASDGTAGRTLTGHTGPIYGVAFSPDGNLLVSGGGVERALRLWKTPDGALLRRLAGHGAGARWVAFSPDGGFLASAGADQTVRLWDVRTWTVTRALAGHTAAVHCVAFSPDGSLLASAGADQTVRLWDVRTWTVRHTLTGHAYSVTSVSFSPDGSLLASAGGDKTVRLWDTAEGTAMGILTGHTELVYTVSFSPDGSLLASAGADKTVRLWHAGSGRPGGSLMGHDSAVICVAFSPDGKLLASAGSDHKLLLWG